MRCIKARRRSCWKLRAAPPMWCFPRATDGATTSFMLTCIKNVLSKDDVAEFRRIMDASEWEDGRSTAGAQSAMVKRNEQLPPDGEVARKLGQRIISALTKHPR